MRVVYNRQALIVDSHVYCFEPIAEPAGFESPASRLAWVQEWIARHHQPAFRLHDRAPIDSSTLLQNGSNFRFDPASRRLVWTVDGEDCTKQVYPLGLPDLGYEAPALIAEMDYGGVDVGLLNVDHTLGRSVEFLVRSMRQYPDRLVSMLPVEEWRVASETETVLSELRRWRSVQGFRGLKFIPWYAYRRGVLDSWLGSSYEFFWAGVEDLGLPVFFTLAPRPDAADEVSGFLAELQMVHSLLERYPALRCSVTHGFPYRALIENGRLVVPEDYWRPFENPNLSLEVSFPVRLGDLFAYPYREVWPLVEEMCRRIGPNRLLWGSDMPFQNRFCTYRQSRDWLGEFLGQPELRAIMGGTAARLLRLDQLPEPAGAGSQAPESSSTF
jgi:predicted TIM-barrel fold metal-dependent hydrolase